MGNPVFGDCKFDLLKFTVLLSHLIGSIVQSDLDLIPESLEQSILYSLFSWKSCLCERCMLMNL